ncbi:hypothetical protein GCM10009665_68790 [Kitasatospora nipponensis]|uniref:D-mannose binding lectin n=1 Tax=Kitasatospora nipponensis TaxID=258049 RepID=A0ABP4HQC2_9ACTN
MHVPRRLAWPLVAALAIPVVASWSTPATATAAEAAQPTVVEDFSYPGAAQVLADRGITLKSGDGHIVLADCASGGNLLQLFSRSATPSEVCFQITGQTGYLSLEIPQIYNIKGDDHTVKATLNTEGTVTSLDVAKNAWNPVGEGSSTGATTLLELTATDGPAVTPPAPAYPAVGTVTIGQPGHPGSRSCTGTLVDTQWVLSAASCFADNPADLSTVPTGAPRTKSTVTLGGQTVSLVGLTPRSDRDLVLARLGSPVFDVTPVPVASTAPTQGETLKVAGFGRTRTEWIPSAQHAGTFGVDTVNATTLAVSGQSPAGIAVCAGDAGAPALRESAGRTELAAVSSTSWQNGCLASAETRTGATEARIDDLGQWVKNTVSVDSAMLAPGARLNAGQSLAGRDLVLTMQPNGNLTVTHRTAPNGVIWSSGTAGNNGAYAIMQTDGNLVVYKAGGGSSSGGALWASSTYFNNGAYLRVQDDGNIVVYKKNGGPAVGNALWSTGTVRVNPTIASGQPVWTGQWTDEKSTVLIMQQDGNLVLYRKSDGAALWNSRTAGNNGAWLAMQGDGNAVVYKAGGSSTNGGAVWASGTFGNAGAYLKLQDDGNLVVYKANGGQGIGNAIWSTSTFA